MATRTLDNCRLVTTYGRPRQYDGKCEGYGTDYANDEPCEICKRCRFHYLYTDSDNECSSNEMGDELMDEKMDGVLFRLETAKAFCASDKHSYGFTADAIDKILEYLGACDKQITDTLNNAKNTLMKCLKSKPDEVIRIGLHEDLIDKILALLSEQN